MTLFIQRVTEYWLAGGPLLIPLAGISFAIWFLFLRLRREFLLTPAGGRRPAGFAARAERDRLLLVALTAAAPLVGLLGTVTGMMGTFHTVAAAGGGPDLGAGLARALITTQCGLAVALPGWFGLMRLRRWQARAGIAP